MSIASVFGKIVTGAYRGRFQSSGKYLFVAHPKCCPKCSLLGQSPHFFNTPDVAFITHPNCKCATIEAPPGLSPAELMEWAKNPVGIMRFGFNYGVALKEINVTDRNRANQMLAFQNRMGSQDPRTKIRSDVTRYQINKIRRQVDSGALGPAKNFTAGIKRSITRANNKKSMLESFRAVSPSMRKSIIAGQERARRRDTSGIATRRRLASSNVLSGSTSARSRRRDARNAFMSRRR